MNVGWTRTRGRADYTGFALHVRGTRAQMHAGHPLFDCIVLWLMWRIGLIPSTPRCGHIIRMTIVRRRPA